MKKLILLAFALFGMLAFTVDSYAAWSFNSACTYVRHHQVDAATSFFYMQCDLNSDGSAETDIDLWDSFQENADVSPAHKTRLDSGGVLYAVEYKQGTTAPDNDFVLTLYNGSGSEIFNETIDYDEDGYGITGGIYGGDITKGFFPPINKGLVMDVADIGGSGDDIVITIIFAVSSGK